MKEDYGLRVLIVGDNNPKPLSDDMRTIVFQACRELLINVAKHAETETARVALHWEENRLCLTVEDRGAGFDPASITADGFGLFSIRERFRYLGGDMVIESAPGQGARVTLWVELAKL
jgi:signal transduction histidine kinase